MTSATMAHVQITLDQYVQRMEPIFVIAPSARNGITLIQRLLNSTGEIIVYGENAMFMDRLPLLVNTAHNEHEKMKGPFAASRRRFLTQGGEYWSSDLWPDSERFFLVLLEAFYKAAVLYQEHARSDGFPHWGIKNPLSTALMIDRLKVLIPRSRFIFVYRNLFDVARSAKARQFVKSEDDLAKLAQQWQTNVIGVMDAAWDNVCVLRYEEMLVRPEEQIRRIERFTGLDGIDRSVMTRKINTFEGALKNGCSPTGYIPPAALGRREAQVLCAQASVALGRTGYEDAPAAAPVA